MKVLMCQINTTPGDFEGNVKKIKDGITHGFVNGVDLIVFPELSIPGYSVKDMIYEQGFVDRNLDALTEICSYYDIETLTYKGVGQKSPTVVVGYIDHNRTGTGKPFHNMAAVIKDGRVDATYKKQLLPFYDVFDEGRYFEPGKELTVIEVAGSKFGIIICEDGWNDKGMDDYNYRVCPLERYREIGIHNIISINSSPFVVGKPQKRVQMFEGSSKDGVFIYVNQIGGQDELVFDGHSFICEYGRTVSYISLIDPANRTYRLFDSKDDESKLLKLHPIDALRINGTHILYEALKLGLYDYVTKSGFSQVVVGSSGGIDSAVVLALACDALGSENVNGISMPSIYSSQGSKDDAWKLHKELGCWHYQVPIEHESLLSRINGDLQSTCISTGGHHKESIVKKASYNKVADENIQARLRGQVVMHFSNAFGALPLTTGNKTELALGYCTLYGDMSGGYAPISDLYKLEVKSVAAYINELHKKEIIPKAILEKAPSAELAPGQTDEASLLPYNILDLIVLGYVEGYVSKLDEFIKWIGIEYQKQSFGKSNFYIQNPVPCLEWAKTDNAELQYNRMIRLIKLNEFKRRQAAPGIKTHQVAFGTGRRIPIVKK